MKINNLEYVRATAYIKDNDENGKTVDNETRKVYKKTFSEDIANDLIKFHEIVARHMESLNKELLDQFEDIDKKDLDLGYSILVFDKSRDISIKTKNITENEKHHKSYKYQMHRNKRRLIKK